jgi:hypothetical protein
MTTSCHLEDSNLCLPIHDSTYSLLLGQPPRPRQLIWVSTGQIKVGRSKTKVSKKKEKTAAKRSQIRMRSRGFKPPSPPSSRFSTPILFWGGHHGPQQLIWASNGQIEVGKGKTKIRKKIKKKKKEWMWTPPCHLEDSNLCLPSQIQAIGCTFGAASKATTAYLAW